MLNRYVTIMIKNTQKSKNGSNVPIAIDSIMNPPIFSPMVDIRFIVSLMDNNLVRIVPDYVIKATQLPSFRINWRGKRIYDDLNLKLYCPINPNTVTHLYDALEISNKWYITIKLLGPIGDVVQVFSCKGKLSEFKFSELDWSLDADPVLLTLKFKISDVLN